MQRQVWDLGGLIPSEQEEYVLSLLRNKFMLLEQAIYIYLTFFRLDLAIQVTKAFFFASFSFLKRFIPFVKCLVEIRQLFETCGAKIVPKTKIHFEIANQVCQEEQLIKEGEAILSFLYGLLSLSIERNDYATKHFELAFQVSQSPLHVNKV